MLKQVLLADTSITVQKVVALCLDKTKFHLTVVTRRDEILKKIGERCPDLILLSDQIEGVNSASFPMEVEVLLGRAVKLPPFLLLCTTQHTNIRHYAAVLRKPFMPQALQELVDELVGPSDYAELPLNDRAQGKSDDFETSFSDESYLTQQTFQAYEAVSPAAPPLTASSKEEQESLLWDNESRTAMTEKQSIVLDSQDSLAYKSALQGEVDKRLQSEELSKIVERALAELLPPIVEKLVQSRLDDLLKGAPRVNE